MTEMRADRLELSTQNCELGSIFNSNTFSRHNKEKQESESGKCLLERLW